MKTVMISIQPKWCELIASGKKTIEVRKNKPKIDEPFMCYIYCTYGNALADLSNCCCKSIEEDVERGDVKRYALQEHKIKEPMYSTCAYGNGKVMGYFVCDKIDIIPQYRHCDCNPFDSTADCEICKPRKELCNKSCLCGQEIIDYLGYDTIGYAWHISDLVIYDKPKELCEFYSAKVCKDYWDGNSGCDDVCGIAENNQCRGGHTALRNPPQSWGYVEEIGVEKTKSY